MAARTARHRAPGRRLGRWLAPVAGTTGLWLAANGPDGAAGFAGTVAAGLFLGLAWPLLALIAVESPGALVPARWRAWWRRGRDGRPHISDRLRRIVYAADRHACSYCKSSQGLQLDHLRPWSFGGRTSFWNFMTLCRDCNLVKSNYWQARDGRAYYRPFAGHGDIVTAAQILAFERRHRLNLFRLIRASMAL
jgi:HNH endonuclease